MQSRYRIRTVLILSIYVSIASTALAADSEEVPSQTIRCAVIGGMMDTDFWPKLSKRFELSSCHRVEVVAKGPKHVIRRAFVAGKADLITMHASDVMINLVADGYGVAPQPWAKNDLVLVGPAADPAGIRGMTDAAEALRKIVKTKSELLIQRSLGAQQVLFDLVAMGRVQLDWQHVVVHLDDKRREMLLAASQKNAYVLVGRIPFLNGKIRNRDLVIMVQGDPRLRRPYLVVVANPRRQAPALAAATRQLAAYLHKPETQAWIAEYGRGRLDSQPLFFPVKIPGKNGPGS